MTTPIKPTDEELAAAGEIQALRAIAGEQDDEIECMADTIARHTRCEGNTAKEWALRVWCEPNELVNRLRQELEQAEARCRELEGQVAALRDALTWLHDNCPDCAHDAVSTCRFCRLLTDTAAAATRHDELVRAEGCEKAAIAIECDALRIPLGEAFSGGGLDDTPKFDVAMWAVRTIRQRAAAHRAKAKGGRDKLPHQ